ncbi:hypothetical protein KIL84_004593 [Mauremys mutica]|uniref:Uncharacterized protein n=1 Tax=Mauremys mutica TaxID=74926 RepID=A0A9D3XNF9_9SAUR|nr:hypothetical protein KIL84_004593 [Mauremys mutica]
MKRTMGGGKCTITPPPRLLHLGFRTQWGARSGQEARLVPLPGIGTVSLTQRHPAGEALRMLGPGCREPWSLAVRWGKEICFLPLAALSCYTENAGSAADHAKRKQSAKLTKKSTMQEPEFDSNLSPSKQCKTVPYS